MDIIRPQTAAEKADFKQLGAFDYRKKFEADLAEYQQKNAGDYKPFCMRCARIDYYDKIDKMAKEMERSQGGIDFSNPQFKNISVNFADYTLPARFDLKRTTEIHEASVLDGEKISKLTGYYEDYECKVRNCGISVQIPRSIYEKKSK